MSTPRKILYVQYTNPAGYPPLEHSSRILANAGWKVLFLGTGALGAGALRFRPHSNIKVHQLTFCAAGWRQKLHYAAFCFWVFAWTIAWRPKWVYASDPLSCPIALLLSCLAGVRAIYHEHDSPDSENVASPFSRFLLSARRRLARRAASCVLPNQRRADRFKGEVGNAANVICVWNCPTREEIVETRSSAEKEVWLLYHGSIVPSRLPLTVLEALAGLPHSVNLRIVGYETAGHSGYLQSLKQAARLLGIDGRVQILGALPKRAELLEWCSESDIGLALLPRSKNGHCDINLETMTGASNKAFDYLARGLPLIVSDLPDWQELYVKPGYALACTPEDPHSIAQVLKWFLEHPIELRQMGERGRQRILADWNYETQFRPVAKVLNR